MDRRRQDQRIFEKLIRFLEREKPSARIPGELMLAIGKFFLGTPYEANTLETKKDEHLVINLRKYDCFTLVENMVALVWLMESYRQACRCSMKPACDDIPAKRWRSYPAAGIQSPEKSFEAFRRLLRKIRYRQSKLQGYSSRLHYFSDWIFDNQKKDIVRDVTAEIGGRPLKKAMTFMTAHPDLYPPLKDAVNLQNMKSVERMISRRPLLFIPKKAVRHLEDRICDGDLISITSNIEGLDVQHVGFAARVKNRIHLLHASSIEGSVVFSKETLYRYLMQSRTRSGIMVARVTI